MADVVALIAAVAWLVLAIVQANVIAKWNKKFNCALGKLKDGEGDG